MTPRPCPHPEKRWYATKALAKRALRKQRGVGDARSNIRAYRCACGGFHLGHKLRTGRVQTNQAEAA